nr:amidase domain-containing protein [Bifidobacterium dentium]
MAKRNFGDNSAGVNYITLSRYADTWTNKQHEKQMNPKYPVFKNGNCANFASQALHEAGLSVTHLWNYSTVSPELLTTKSWMNANSNYYYMKNTLILTQVSIMFGRLGKVAYCMLTGIQRIRRMRLIMRWL